MGKVSRFSVCFVVVFVVCFAAQGSCVSGGSRLVDILPEHDEIEGWERDGEHLSYDAENLWEYINGSAENFLTYDFKEVIAQDYKSKTGKNLKVEIYRHGNSLMAFGIYSQYRGPDLTFYDIGNEGFGDAYSFHFWKGDCYVRINVFERSEETAGDMKEFARLVASKIEDAGMIPEELSCFPVKGLVEKSITYVTVGVLGSGKLPPAFIGDYRSGDDVGKLYLFQCDDKKDSREKFVWYTGEMEAEVTEGIAGKEKYLKAVCDHPYRGEMLVFQYGKWLGVLTGFEKAAKVREELLGRAVERIAGSCERLKS